MFRQSCTHSTTSDIISDTEAKLLLHIVHAWEKNTGTCIYNVDAMELKICTDIYYL